MKKLVLTIVGLLVMGWAMAQSGNHWTVITGTQYNMTVKGIILIDGVTQANDQLEIGAFCGDECRGSRKAAFFPPSGEYPVMLTVVSNVYSGETITFRIYDHATQQELNLESESALVFEHNTNQGSMGSWFPFTFTTPAFHFTASGNWSEASNWQGGAVPTATSAIVIDANCTLDQNAEVTNLTVSDGAALTLQSGKTLTVTGDLVNTAVTGIVIKDGAQLINASANVKATAEKDITAYGAGNPDGWYTLGSPMNKMTIAGSGFLTPNYDLYRYNETRIGGEWENYKDNSNTEFTVFENGRGYLYANSNTDHYDFTGTLNNAAVSCEVTYTDRPDGLSGINLIGNPFPHAIYKGAGCAIDNASLASGYYTLTNEGAWHVHTYKDAIMPGQGVLVRTIATTMLNIAKTNAAATAESSSKEMAGRLSLKVDGETGHDRAFVYFSQGIGLEKLENFNGSLPSLYVSRNAIDYAIVHVGLECESLELGFHSGQSGEFALGVEVEGLSLSYLHLIDRVAGAEIDLLQQPDYSFTATGNEDEARFELVFRGATGVEEMTEDEPFAFISDGNLIVNGEGTLQIFDALGRQLFTSNLSSLTSPGGYVLRLMDENSVRTQKIIIK